ncbi:transglutaminase domain-containing protein [Streptomyces sp. NPDC087901]|uniref:transglutaminase domain-containing protein n=1 Tax=Streptomyces sp. NPDC087901 TaxID=3365818 RepID=UPI003816B07E
MAESEEAALRAIVERIRRVPDVYRVFRQDTRDAGWHHGIEPPLLEALMEAGLPFRRTGGTVRYDQLDLANASLALRMPSPRYLSMRGWSAAIRATANTPSTLTYEVEVKPSGRNGDPAAGLGAAPTTDSRLEPAAPLLARPECGRSADGSVTLTRTVHGRSTRVFPEAEAITNLVAPIHFHLIPPELRADLAFLAESRLADCALASTFLVREAGALGLRARRSFGLFLAAPYSIPHAWMELHIDGRWVSFDPHLLNLLCGWGLLPADAWPANRSIGEAAWRLAADEFVLATSGGVPTQLSFPTRARDGQIGA